MSFRSDYLDWDIFMRELRSLKAWHDYRDNIKFKHFSSWGISATDLVPGTASGLVIKKRICSKCSQDSCVCLMANGTLSQSKAEAYCQGPVFRKLEEWEK